MMTFEEATDIIYESTPVDYISKSSRGDDFIMFICSYKGNTVVYKVYENGIVTKE